MGELFLQSEQKNNFTIVSNSFIDNEMCNANGDFVKVYLYINRCVTKLPEGFSISLIADKFNLTENDVIRALRYWEKRNLLSLALNGNEILGISLHEPSDVSIYKKDNLSDKDIKYYTPSAFNQTSPQIAATKQVSQSNDEPIVMKHSATTAVNAYQAAAAMKNDVKPKPDLSAIDNARIKEILMLAETYLKKPLTSDETMTIYYFYDTLHFSPDLIQYLIEYCIDNDKKNMRYIEKVALSWAEKGITTIAEAKEESEAHNKDFFAILKAFGIRDRYPVDSENEYMTKWLRTFHFDLEIVLEACARTMKKGHQAAPFTYADKILTNWYENGVVTKQDIKTLDALHSRKKAAQAATPTPTQATSRLSRIDKVSGNSFNNFDQRTTDYDALEQQLSQL